MAARTSRVLHRSLRETPPRAIGGEGIYLFAEDGRRILAEAALPSLHAEATMLDGARRAVELAA